MKTVDISGFGGSYEAGCQKMLLAGLRYLKEHPNFDFSAYKKYKGIYGLCIGEGEEAEALDKAIEEGMGSTGAMHQAVISHLAYIHANGYDKWVSQAEIQGTTTYEAQSEENLNAIIQKSQEEWQAQIDAGYDPLKDLLEKVPKENIVEVYPDDPESVKRAVEEVASLIKGPLAEKENNGH